MTAYLSPILSGPQFGNNGSFLRGGLIWTYAAGTTTPLATYTGPDAGTAHTNPIVLNARGEVGGEIWLDEGQAYKMVLESTPASGETHGAVLNTYDNITGINDSQSNPTNDSWILYSGTPTRISDTSFSVAGDHRDVFQVGRRLKCTVGASTVYSLIDSVSYGSSITTVTVINDSGTLTSDLTAVRYAWIETDPVTCGLASLANGLNNVSLVGSVLAFAGSSAPAGFLLCDGSAVSRTTYAALFAVVGSTWGSGDGSTTFNVPDFRGVFLRGLNTSGSGYDPSRVLASLQADTLKEHTHTANHSHTAYQAPHTHSYTDYTVSGDAPLFIGSGANYGYKDNPLTTGSAAPAITVDTTNITTSGASTGAYPETRPVNKAVNFIIKY